jgi:hypothetical protein
VHKSSLSILLQRRTVPAPTSGAHTALASCTQRRFHRLSMAGNGGRTSREVQKVQRRVQMLVTWQRSDR